MFEAETIKRESVEVKYLFIQPTSCHYAWPGPGDWACALETGHAEETQTRVVPCLAVREVDLAVRQWRERTEFLHEWPGLESGTPGTWTGLGAGWRENGRTLGRLLRGSDI